MPHRFHDLGQFFGVAFGSAVSRAVARRACRRTSIGFVYHHLRVPAGDRLLDLPAEAAEACAVSEARAVSFPLKFFRHTSLAFAAVFTNFLWCGFISF